MALASASLLALAVQAGAIWSMANGTVEVGPRFSFSCMGGTCTRTGLSWLGADESWSRAGSAMYVTGLVAALALVMFGGALAAGRKATWTAGLTITSTLTLVLASVAFIARMPEMEGTSPGRGMLFLWLGVALGLGAATFVLLRDRFVK